MATYTLQHARTILGLESKASGNVSSEQPSEQPSAWYRCGCAEDDCSAMKCKKRRYTVAYYVSIGLLVVGLIALQVLFVKVGWNFLVPRIVPSVRPISFVEALVMKLLLAILVV